MFTRENLALMLSQSVATVKFIKVDGSVRVMHCTIAPHLIPEEKRPVFNVNHIPLPPKLDLTTLRVFDLDANDWRSFKVANVKEISPGYYDYNQSSLLLG